MFDSKIKMFQSDGGREFDNKDMHRLFSTSGILFRKSFPDTQQQNGVAERKHRHILEMVRTILLTANLPAHFWVDAVYASVYTINRFRTPILQNKTLFQFLFGRVPEYNFLKVFGCECYPNFIANSGNKLQPRSKRCVFLGYAPNYKGYRCLDPITGRVYISRDAIFCENKFPYYSLLGQSGESVSASYSAILHLGDAPMVTAPLRAGS